MPKRVRKQKPRSRQVSTTQDLPEIPTPTPPSTEQLRAALEAERRRIDELLKGA